MLTWRSQKSKEDIKFPRLGTQHKSSQEQKTMLMTEPSLQIHITEIKYILSENKFLDRL